MKKTILALIAAGLAHGAVAGFVDQSASNPFAHGQQLRVIGADRFEEVPGFARAVPLHEALAQIIPRTYSVRTRGIEAVQTTVVSWQGGKTWDRILRDVLDQVPRLHVEIDTASKIVTFDLAAPADMATDASVGSSLVANEPAVLWAVKREDLTVRAALERWAANAGWQLVWELPVDFPIEAEASISSTFEAAVETLTKSLQGAAQPPKAIIYRGNRVVRIVARGME